MCWLENDCEIRCHSLKRSKNFIYIDLETNFTLFFCQIEISFEGSKSKDLGSKQH